MRLAYAPYMLKFRQPAGTSRGVLTEKPTYIIKIFDEKDPTRFGLGECAVFPGLSPEANSRYEYKLVELLANVALGRNTDLSRHSSIQFGFEQALRDFTGGCQQIYFPSAFTEGKESIEINGLVWMGSFDEMLERIEEKVAAGFKCIKLKIGAIDWKNELDLVRHIRDKFTDKELQIRVDANGAFTMEAVFPKLKALADLGVHSIEQPLPASYPAELLGFVCRMSPLAIALDESLIGVYGNEAKKRLLDEVNPAYVILKPALCGGFSGAEEWIGLAEERGIGWWVTSALESNVGLNALAQWTATLGVKIPQGLGTGALYTNNFGSPLQLDADNLSYNPDIKLDIDRFENLDWRE